MNPRIAALPRPLRLAAVLALAFAYLSQALPHAHADAHHPDPHPAPIAHTHDHGHDHHHHHAHAPETHEADHGPSGPGRHHHEIARHLDVHFLRDVLIATGDDQLNPALPAAASAMPESRPANERIARAAAAPLPADPLLPHALPRAPPA